MKTTKELVESINREYELAGKSEDKIEYTEDQMDKTDFNIMVSIQYKKALETAIFKRFVKYFEAQIENGEFDENEQIKIANEYLADNSTGKFIKTDLMYLTIRPQEEYNNIEMLPLFIKQIAKLCNKKWIKNYLYVIEQSGMTKERLGFGFHAHILIHHDSDNKKFSEFKKEIANSVKDLGVKPNGGIDIKNCIKEQAYKNYRNYLLGNKDCSKERNKDKKVKQQLDIPFRERYNIKPYYTNSLEFFENYSLI